VEYHGRGDQAALIYDSPVTDTIKHLHLQLQAGNLRAEVARGGSPARWRGPRAWKRATGSSSTCPWCRGGDRHAGLCPHRCVHSVVFGGFSARELATRIDDAKPKVIVAGLLRHRAEPVIVHYKPLLDDAIDRPPQAGALHHPAAPQAPGELIAGPRPGLGRGPGRPSRRLRQVAATDPLYILYTSGTTGSPRGGARQRRPCRGHGLEHENVYNMQPARCSGRPPTSAGWWATPTSSTPRCSTAAPRCSTRASRWARRTPGPSGG
jgi:propionyl-CoA synthetase